MRIGKKAQTFQPNQAMKAEKFREYTDLLVELFHLDPELPEIADLKAHAQDLVAPYGAPLLFLAMLNPDKGVHVRDGVTILDEQMSGSLLQPWSIGRHHCAWIDQKLVKIVADNDGTHLFASDDVDEYEMFRVSGGAIDPRRFADPGDRYELACAIIEEFTSLEIDHTQHVGSTKSIIVTKAENGSWKVEFVRSAVLSG